MEGLKYRDLLLLLRGEALKVTPPKPLNCLANNSTAENVILINNGLVKIFLNRARQ